MQLRPYQGRGLEALRAHARAGRRRLLLTMPTGAGKTVVAGSLIHSARTKFNANVLFVAHRLELIDQAVRQIAAWGVPHIGVIRADDERTDAFAPVQVATIQTLSRRFHVIPKADIIIVDEAHRAMADSYQALMALFPEASIIGLTATPCRMDGKALGDSFEALVQLVNYSQLIAEGSIVAPRTFSSRVLPDLSGVHTRAGDYKIDEIETVMADVKLVGNVVDEWERHAEGRASVIFAATIVHSQAIGAAFKARGVRVEHLDALTPLDVRRGMLARLESGETQVITNVGVLCEGWDQPCVKYLGLVRPTQSLALYMQTGGRVLRPWCPCHGNGAKTPDGKPCPASVAPIIVDHGRNVDRHGLVHEDRDWDLKTGAKPRERVKLRTCPSCFAIVQKNPCELCGFAPPVAERAQPKTAENVALVERSTDPRLVYFESKIAEAKTKGFKPGYAAAKFKEKFGGWPPWSWSEKAHNAFAVDLNWQAKQLTREKERSYWQARQRRDEQSEQVETVDDPDDGGILGLLK